MGRSLPEEFVWSACVKMLAVTGRSTQAPARIANRIRIAHRVRRAAAVIVVQELIPAQEPELEQPRAPAPEREPERTQVREPDARMGQLAMMGMHVLKIFAVMGLAPTLRLLVVTVMYARRTYVIARPDVSTRKNAKRMGIYARLIVMRPQGTVIISP